MPVHVEEMTSEVTVIDGDLPLTDQQVEALVGRVLRRLGEKKREAALVAEATKVRRQSVPEAPIGD
jgi:hypothetical protein